MYFLYLGWVYVGDYKSHPCLEPTVGFENKKAHPHFILLLAWGGQKLSSLTKDCLSTAPLILFGSIFLLAMCLYVYFGYVVLLVCHYNL